MYSNLRPFRDVVRELSVKYNIPFEIVESILVDWVELLYYSARPEKNDLPKSLE
jgi:hypothetical protein